MADIFFLYNDAQIIPADLLRAALDFDNFRAAHLEYWRKHGGEYGTCTYQDAFEYLVSDMEDHNLPVRYSSFSSFMAYRSRKK